MDGNSRIVLDGDNRPWDAIVIGAGPAGGLSAYLLAKRGLKTLLVERKPFPRNKVCGGCLNARAVWMLESVGLGRLVNSETAGSTDSLQLQSPRRSIVIPVPGGKVVARSQFDATLVEAAVGQGAHFLDNTCAEVEPNVINQLRTVTLKSNGESLANTHARVVLACDGLGGGSLVRLPWMRSTSTDRSRVGLGTVAHCGCRLSAGRIYMAAHPQGYVGAVRVPDGTVNVAAAVDRQALLHRNPAEVMSEILLACRFPPASDLVLSQVKGTALLTRQSNRLADERLFLVGDAGGYLEPITGEGMAWAFASALAVASLAVAATTQWKPRMEEQWQHAANQVVSRRQTICWSLSRLCRHPWLLDLAMRTVTCVPSLAAACVSQLNKIATESEALC